MTKFRDMDDDQKAMAREMLMRAIDRRVKEDMEYTSHVYRLLVLGNGAGIVLLVSFIGVVAGRGHPVAELVPPLWKFLLGCILAALIYAPYMVVAVHAVDHAADQMIKFLKNEIDFESIRSWVFNIWVKRMILLLVFSSFLLFVIGVIQSIFVLASLS